MNQKKGFVHTVVSHLKLFLFMVTSNVCYVMRIYKNAVNQKSYWKNVVVKVVVNKVLE